MAPRSTVDLFRNNPKLTGGLFVMLLFMAEIGQVAAVGSAISGP